MKRSRLGKPAVPGSNVPRLPEVSNADIRPAAKATPRGAWSMPARFAKTAVVLAAVMACQLAGLEGRHWNLH